MWRKLIAKYFARYPAQQKVAELFLSYGLSVKKGRVFCGDIELSFSKIARAIKVDRRAVMATVETIEREEALKKIFAHLKPTCNFKDLAPKMKWGVVEIIPSDASMPGILADVARVIAKEGISIRQANVDDYVITEEPKLFIITEKNLPPHIIEKLRKAKGVEAVTVY
ncbi:MAG: ACT domain-containing protein [Thermoplasmata archaeon]|nr:ACT domain-containing protein [Thermoplasmata archaeon]